MLKIEDRDIVKYSTIESENIIKKINSELFKSIITTPIKNLKLNVDSIQIGQVKFTHFDEPKLYETDRNKKINEDIKKRFFPMFKDTIVGIIEIHSIDSNKAFELGEQLIEQSLDIIRFYGLSGFVPNPLWSNNYFDIQGKLISGKVILLQEVPSKQVFLHSLSQHGYLFPFEINQEFIDFMHKNSFIELNLILNKKTSERSNFENRILSAIRLAGKSYMDSTEYESFLKCTISLESLLLKDREVISDNLAERMAFIISNKYEDRILIYDIMKKLYNIRSQIVHAGLIEVRRSDLYQLQIFTFMCIVNLLKLYKKENLSNIDDFIDWIRKLKFSI